MKYFWRKPCCVVFLILSLGPVAGAQASAAQQRATARRFLASRGLASRRHALPGPVAGMGTHTRLRHSTQSRLSASANTALAAMWTPIGPLQTMTPAYGAITGRVTSIAVDPADATGNTVYAGTTGGGVWKSTNAAGAAAQVAFAPVTDDATASLTGVGSLSIGAVSVQPGGTGVVLAGTGDPNDALDSYYGSGILRSTDHGATWATITNANVGDYTAGSSFSFYGEGFSGFAWSSTTANLVVAAVTQAYDGTVVNALQPNSVDGLYYSTDAGATWLMSTLEDGPNEVFQSPSTTTISAQGNAVTSVVWNPFRQAFYAAIRYHGYYLSPDGITWTRLANQPGVNLSTMLCPNFGSAPGSLSCPLFRGALAVQPQTGDMFAITVDGNLLDQGIWQDACTANGASCTTQVTFGTQIPDTELQDGSGRIAQGDYNLWLAAVPSNADTLLYAGTEDIFKWSLAASNVPWRNTTNTNTCTAAKVAPAQHAIATTSSGSLMYFGNDGGLWRTTDGIAQQQAACSADDAAHFDNLNSSLGSLAEVTSLAQSPGGDTTLLVGEGVNGTAGTTTEQGAWPQVLDGLGGYTAIDPANPQNWYITSGPGVAISSCGNGGACNASAFAVQSTIGDAQTDSDGESLGEPAVWMLDPQDTTKMLIGTCRVWRGSVPGSVAAAADTAVSAVFDDAEDPDCTGGAGQVQSLGASGTISGSVPGVEILYAGMEGIPGDGGALPYGGLASGHVFTATINANQASAILWTDTFASPVVNDTANSGQFNPGGFGVSAVVVDTHDATGQTVYATIQGFSGNGISEPLVYRSSNQGQNWSNITANLPDVPVNALVVDPGDANTVYLGTDAGVYVATSIAACTAPGQQCWSTYGVGLPDAPVTTLVTDGAANDFLLVAGTYGRGAWEMQLASACDVKAIGSAPQLEPASGLAFGNVPVGSSSSLAVTITNSGSATCVTSVQASAGFTESDACTGKLLVQGASCTVTVIFAPGTAEAYAGTLTVTSNVQTAGTASVSLSGKGVAAKIELDPTQLVFGPMAVGAPTAAQYITVSNTGDTAATMQSTSIDAKDYALTSSSNCTGVLAGNSGCTVGIVFTPSHSGPDNGVFTISTSVGNFAAQLTGRGLSPGNDTQSTAQLAFGPQQVGTRSLPQTVTLTNTGGEAVISIVPVSSLGDFVVTKNGCATNLPAGESCSIAVVFAPAQPGARAGVLTIADSLHSGSSALSVKLTGSGVAPSGVSLLPASIDFGAQGIGSTSPAQSVTLTNESSTALARLTFAASGNFAVQSGTCGGTLAAGKSCALEVTFTPNATGSRTGILNAYANQLQTDLTIALNGIGLSFALGKPNPATQTVVTGTAATYMVSIATLGSGYPAGVLATLTLACSGADALPAGSTCIANPASADLTSSFPQSVTVTVTTPVLATTSSRRDEELHLYGWVLAFALPLFGLCRRNPLRAMCLLLAAVVCAGAFTGCGVTASGGGSTTKGTGTTGGGVPSTYVLTLKASAPGLQQSATMTLVLEQ